MVSTVSRSRNRSLTTRLAADIKVHTGFQKTFERTADGMLEAVRAGLESKGVNKVLVTGHSLGEMLTGLQSVTTALMRFLRQGLLSRPSILFY